MPGERTILGDLSFVGFLNVQKDISFVVRDTTCNSSQLHGNVSRVSCIQHIALIGRLHWSLAWSSKYKFWQHQDHLFPTSFPATNNYDYQHNNFLNPQPRHPVLLTTEDLVPSPAAHAVTALPEVSLSIVWRARSSAERRGAVPVATRRRGAILVYLMGCRIEVLERGALSGGGDGNGGIHSSE